MRQYAVAHKNAKHANLQWLPAIAIALAVLALYSASIAAQVVVVGAVVFINVVVALSYRGKIPLSPSGDSNIDRLRKRFLVRLGLYPDRKWKWIVAGFYLGEIAAPITIIRLIGFTNAGIMSVFCLIGGVIGAGLGIAIHYSQRAILRMVGEEK